MAQQILDCSHDLGLLPQQQVPAAFEAEEACSWDVLGAVLRRRPGAVAIVPRADSEGWRADGFQVHTRRAGLAC